MSNGGLSKALGTMGLTSIISLSFISFAMGFSGSGGFIFECFDNVQPLILRNSVKSVHFYCSNSNLYKHHEKLAGQGGAYRNLKIIRINF